MGKLAHRHATVCRVRSSHRTLFGDKSCNAFLCHCAYRIEPDLSRTRHHCRIGALMAESPVHLLLGIDILMFRLLSVGPVASGGGVEPFRQLPNARMFSVVAREHIQVHVYAVPSPSYHHVLSHVRFPITVFPLFNSRSGAADSPATHLCLPILSIYSYTQHFVQTFDHRSIKLTTLLGSLLCSIAKRNRLQSGRTSRFHNHS